MAPFSSLWVLLLWNRGRVDTKGVRFLFVNNHCISDPTAGVTQSLRTIMEWLAEAGHECEILTTARFESRVTFTLAEHLAGRGVELERQRPRRPLPCGPRSSDAAGHAP